ncbi:alpha/beta hydrolase [Romeria aff. gracilis LEGE 07310]|uniref:Alpha/beta hydrolase n=1 Tax=Vasconcelosia minhoensis LEGE 07310 TaxID=915328 RepID=A0A8J7DE40_9CYAN|nr:alpha/beta hydrolase [Romeria gracilis]MBE9079463.1 alpha/beta hydrolase [Romeria aff. gracilis LEGE 07310]
MRRGFKVWDAVRAYVADVGAVIVTAAAGVLVAAAADAAERIHFQYGFLERSVSLEQIEAFVNEGTVDGSLELLLLRLSPEQQEQLRAALRSRYEVDPVLVNRFSYTSSGRQLLTEAGEVLQTASGMNGLYALRGALTLAAADPEGLTLLNLLRQYPTHLRIDVRRALAVGRSFGQMLADTEAAIARLSEQTQTAAAQAPATDFSQLPDPRQPGPWQVNQQTLALRDQRRNRAFSTDLYLPEGPAEGAALPERLPVIVISNGLGGSRDRFLDLATHLASHGFAVAIPDHPGSDRQRLQAFYQGLYAENFEAAEFIDRPLDIRFLLDELTRLNGERFDSRLNPDQVGVFGYSFGGTTALALAGAEIDLSHLAEDCATRSALINISLLYQCRALALPTDSVSLRDSRVQAVYVFVPFGRSLYGPEGMAQVEIPVMWEATDQDILTPLAIEQLPAFAWLTEPERYLVVTEGLPHARLTLDVVNRLTDQALAWEDVGPIAETYHQMLSLPFFQVYVAEQDVYRPYLQAQAAQELTQEPYDLNWARSLEGIIPSPQD